MKPTLALLTALPFVLAFPLPAAGASLRAKTLETKTISWQPDLYHGWPTVVRRRNGELWLSWSGGRESHICPFGQSVNDWDFKNARDYARHDGSAWVTEPIPPDRLARWKAAFDRLSDEERGTDQGEWVIRSTDGGRSSSEPMPLSVDGTGGDLGYPSTVELGDGTLLTVWYESLKDRPRAVLRQTTWRME